MNPTATLPSASDALAALNGYQAPSSADVLSQAENKYGVNDLQQKVSALNSLTGNLTNAIAAVDPSVTGRTAGTLTTEGQRSALVDRERQPVIGQLGTANQALGNQKDLLNSADTNAKNSANMTIADNQAKYQKLKDTYDAANAREETAKQIAMQQAQAAEQTRQYNQSRQDTLSENAANRAASDARASAPNATQTQQQQIGQISQNLSKLTGKDGKVSEQSWAGAFGDAVAAGYKPEQVWQILGKYVNHKYANTYAGYVSGYGSKYTY